MDEIIKDVIYSVVAIVIPALATLGGTLIKMKIEELQNQKISALAGVIVKSVEDQRGPGGGQAKLEEAVIKLMESSRFKLTGAQAEMLVRATFQNLYGSLAKSSKPEPIQTPVKT